MRNIIEKLIIIFLSTYNILNIYPDNNPIPFLLLSLILSILLDLINKRKLKFSIYIVFVLLNIYNQNFIYYSPLIIYNLYRDMNIFSFTLVFILFLQKHIFLGFLSLISIYLSNNRENYNIKLKQGKFLRDNLREDSISLKKYNEQLIKEREKNIEIAILEERNRISRELHDSVGHLISSSILQLEAMSFTTDNKDILKGLDNIQTRLTLGMKDIRQTIHNIYRDSLNLESQFEKIQKNYPNLDIDILYDIKSNLEYKLKFDILSIVKESITNTSKHSNASHIDIRIIEHPKFYSISIKDNGESIGKFDKDGIGLISIKEIANKYSGFISIDDYSGFKINITLMKGEKNDQGNNNR